ncbi:MAG: glycosyltransferase [Candidatus Sumerlaeaceae bacterium]
MDSGIAALGNKGASVHVRSICGALSCSGCEVFLHCNRVGGLLSQTRSFARHCYEHRIPDSLKRLQRDLRDFYDAELRVPAETRQAMINRAVLPELITAWREQKPAFVLERLSLMGVAGVRACTEVGICHMLEVNALMSDEARAFRSLSDYEMARRAENEVLRSTRRIFCVSWELKEMIIARGVEAHRIEVMPNGYNETLFRPRSGAPLRRKLALSDHFVIGMVGSLKPWHGVGVMLESMMAWSSRRKMALLLVGEGPETQRVNAFKEEHPEIRVVHRGSVPHHEIPAYIAACDICAAPYEHSEAFYFSPLKIYEYLAMAKPVIASDQGQVREIISHGHNGLLFEPGNAEQFTAAVERLRRSPKFRERLAREGRKSVSGHTWGRNARRILAAAKEECA